MEKNKCSNCDCKTGSLGHLCDPKTTTKDTIVYECVDCGIISVEKRLLCKPKILRLK